MGAENMQKRPEIIVYAGPNGSGKTMITQLANVIQPYINADDIQKALGCTNIEAAIKADELRRKYIERGDSFTFETVLSTDRNLKLLQYAKDKGYFIRCVYVLTIDPRVNVLRVHTRVVNGGHSVPQNKIIARYKRGLKLIPELLKVCDICHIYDNTIKPTRIFKKHKENNYFWENMLWTRQKIEELTKAKDMKVRGY